MLGISLLAMASASVEQKRSARQEKAEDAPIEQITEPIVSRPTSMEPPPAPAPSRPSVQAVPNPRGNSGRWVQTRDYPRPALQHEMEGRSAFRLSVDPKGRVSGCKITKTSGYRELDDATCKYISRRGRFNPARDKNGKPVAGKTSSSVRWVIPSRVSERVYSAIRPHPVFGHAIPPRISNYSMYELKPEDYPAAALIKKIEGRVEIKLQVDAQGIIGWCRIQKSSGFKSLDEKSCKIARERWSFLPAEGSTGQAEMSFPSIRFIWKIPPVEDE